MSKLVLIDGHSIINRAFYGVPDLTNASGLHVNAIYGFLNIMFKLIDDEKPDYLCVAFDVKAPTFRHEMYSAYKGTRKPMPQELHEQVPVLKDVLRKMNIMTYEHAGWEADDILGSLARRAERDGMEVSLVSGDRDLLQIATDKIKICLPKTKGGKTETEYYRTQDVIDKYSVPPLGIIELKALMGDSSDNIPGVNKVGEKTATELLVQYGTLDGVYEHIDEITKKALHANLVECREQAYLSKALATIKTDCDTGLSWEELAIGNFYTKEAYDMFVSLEMKSMLKRFDNADSYSNDEEITESFVAVTDIPTYDTLIDRLGKSDRIAFYIEADDEIVSLSVSVDDATYVVMPRFFLTSDYVKDGFAKVCAAGKNMCTFDVKKALRFFEFADYDKVDDIMIQAYLCNPLKSDWSIEDIAVTYLGIHPQSSKEIFGKTSLTDASIEREEEYLKYAGYRSYIIGEVSDKLSEELKSQGMDDLYHKIEMPTAYVLYDMERTGIAVDRDALKTYGESLVGRIGELEKSIYDKAGEEFNINSPKQLGEILFEKLGLQGGKKTKTGYSTAADVLEKLAPEYPIVSDILEYRGLSKLKSTYADGLTACIAADGRIHTNFNQTITATGRISSTEPNLQNIPIRTEQGRLIRKCFVPRDGYIFLDADYSQIELRLLAHMSGDEGLIEAYGMDADIHRITASKVFGIPFDEVTDAMRRDAKAVNFGIVYGISSFGLSQDLGISKKDAEKYIQDYFVTYPKVKAFLDGTVKSATDNGYVDTLYGRRRPIPELSNSNFMVRQFGERVAMNSPIQGTAADIMKIAMINVHKALTESKVDAKILVQVHDELLLEVRADELDRVKDILVREMTEAASLRVNLEVSVSDGHDWYEAK